MISTPELDSSFARIFKPGAVILTSGFKGGGKSHTAIAVAEFLVKGGCESLQNVEIFTNIMFFHRVNGKIVEEAPEHVHVVTTMKDLFPMLVESIETKGRDVLNLLILDEAQNFIGGDTNQSNASVMMKELLGIIRKFRLAVWFLTPSAKAIGPAFRNWINDPKYPGNLTARFLKDLGWNEKYIAQQHLDMDPRSLMQVKNFDSPPFLLEVPVTEWTQTWKDLKEGEYCYDHEASATFYIGEEFDWEDFNRTIGEVSSIRILDTIRDYYKLHHGTNVGAPKLTPEEVKKRIQGEMAVRMINSGKSQREVAKTLGINRETVVRRMEAIGYSSDGSKLSETTANDIGENGIGKKNDESVMVYNQPQKSIASGVAGRSSEGAKIPPIYISREPPENRGVSGKSPTTRKSENSEDEDVNATPIPDGKYTLSELGRAVHHCIGDDDE